MLLQVAHCVSTMDRCACSDKPTTSLSFDCASSVDLDYFPNTEPTVVQDESDQEKIWSCMFDYGSFPVISFACLPIRVQHMIGHLVCKSVCPVFTLATSALGQWCLVQLVENAVTEQLTPTASVPDVEASSESERCPSAPTSLPVDSNSANRFALDRSANVLPNLTVQLNRFTVAEFAGACVTFQYDSCDAAGAWPCPFCEVSFSSGKLKLNHLCVHVRANAEELLKKHLRLHIELRFCLDCVTLLPNSTKEAEPGSQIQHNCNQLISHTRKSAIKRPDASNRLLSPESGCATPVPLVTNHEASKPSVSSICRSRRKQLISVVTSSKGAKSQSSIVNIVTGDVRNPCPVVQKPGEQTILRICTSCNIAFKTSVQYQQHLKNVHRGFRFLCPDCNTSFSTKGNLTTHFREVHNLSNEFRCSLCEKLFSNKFNLNRHVRLTHGCQQHRVDVNIESVRDSSSCCNPCSDREVNRAELEQQDSYSTVTVQNSVSPDCATKVSHEEQPRGFYLFLSNTESGKPSNSFQSVRLINPCNAAAHTMPQPALVAEVQLTPCSPSCPDAQYGPCSRAWHKSVLVSTGVPTSSSHQ
ncbi:hypothetical protein EG68_01186 [Paragonimus skrjabini miyazakii]|uniref:C2H2-type domain-containing protein n=1 Tax=Paragonimus skrjabini miyazakii TaxID=59628 RepID=A0A8S9Z3S9_9TREM|nr:hypothetical protein EG68_01186 [Paragonimus skrjabini miyazakii]